MIGYRIGAAGQVINRLRENTGVNLMTALSQVEITRRIQELQRRIALGDKPCPISELARRAGLDRSTVYEAARGNRISEVSQIRLSRALIALAQEPAAPTKVMHIHLGSGEPRLRFGVAPVGIRRR